MEDQTPPKNVALPQLPFVTREMFKWGSFSEFDLEIRVATEGTDTFQVTGATREAPFTYNIEPGGIENTEQFIRGISDIPVFLSVHSLTSSVFPGEIWVEVYLRANNVRLFKMVSGYISFDRALAYPTGSGNQPAQEEILPKPEAITDPAAGANLDIGPGTNETWIVHSVSLRLTTDANAADRRVHLRVRDSTSEVVQEFFGSVNQTASLTRDYIFQPLGFIATEEDNNIILVPMSPKIVVARLSDLETDIVNIQVGDQLSNVKVNRATMSMNT